MIPFEPLKRVDLRTLPAGSLIDVETKSRHYRIELLGGHAIRISGHPEYCPNLELAQLWGSVDDEGVVKEDLIEPGMRFIFILKNHCPITTSRVVTLQNQSRAGKSCASTH
jgi:hypothetical protein